jgi:putative oxidoreductase
MATFPGSTDLAAVVLRVFLGTILMVHGFPKLFKADVRRQTVGFMKSIGVPPALTLAAGTLEFFGGLALLVGFLTEVAAILIAVEMAGTTYLSRTKLGKRLVLGYELDLAYLAGALALVFLGPGAWSLDGALRIAVEPLWLGIAVVLAAVYLAAVVGWRSSSAKSAPESGP